jgi:hypothetical protein
MLSILTTATAICLPLFFHGVLFDSYPDSWFVEITSSPKLCSLAAIHAGRIIGMIVVEVKPLTACNQEVCSPFHIQYFHLKAYVSPGFRPIKLCYGQ